MSTISAGTTSTTTLIHSGDTTGSLVLKTNDTGSGGTTAVTIDTSQNVGIGTSSPAVKLEVKASSGAGEIRVDSSAGDILQLQSSATESRIGSISAVPLTFRTSNVEAMRIDSSGNVGIGTSSPNKKLEVLGAGEIIRATSNNAAADQLISVKNNSGTANCSTNIFFADRYAASSYASSYIRGTTSGTSALIFATGGTNFTNIYDAGAPTERMRIDSSGNVGIGTASPSYKFHVVGNDLLLTTSSGNTVFGTTTTASGVTVSGGIQALQAQSLRVGTFGGSGAYNMEFVSQNNVRVSMEPAGNFFPQVDNSITIGKSGQRWSAVWAANGTIQTSDINAKIDVVDSPLGLSFIASLRPVAYKYKVGRNQVIDNPEDTDNPTIIPIAGKRQHFGLIAQEVKAALPDGIDFGGWVLTDFEDQNSEQGLRYDQFIAPMIKAIQEQQALIQQLQADVAALKGV